jgi:hypothetical protein
LKKGLKTPRADIQPADGQVFLKEWLDYATQRVPQMQEEKTEGRAGKTIRTGGGFRAGDEKTDPAKRNLQRPRVFYRRDTRLAPFHRGPARTFELAGNPPSCSGSFGGSVSSWIVLEFCGKQYDPRKDTEITRTGIVRALSVQFEDRHLRYPLPFHGNRKIGHSMRRDHGGMLLALRHSIAGLRWGFQL